MRRSAFFVVLALTFAITTAAGNDSPRPAVQSHGSLTEKGDRGTYDNQANPNLSSSAKSAETPTHANSDNAQSSPDKIRQNSDHHDQGWVAVIFTWVSGISAQLIFNLITTVATVFLAIFNWQLVVANRGMRKANERANRLAREALHIAERAYVNVEELKVVSCEIGKPLEFSMTYVNTGRTPATGLDVIARAVLAKSRQGEADIPEGYRKPAPPSARGAQLGGAMRGQRFAHYGDYSDPIGDLPLTREQYAQIGNWELVWSVMVVITYRDQSKNDQLTVEFFMYNPRTRKFETYGWTDDHMKGVATRDIRFSA